MVYKGLSRQCALCQRLKSAEQAFCQSCESILPRIHYACFRCGIDLPEQALHNTLNHNKHTPSKIICGDCLANNPVQYRSLSAFSYRFPIPELIGEIKFHQQLYALKPLAQVFSEYCLAHYAQDQLPECIVPVPLHPHREFTRGFNQSLLFAKALSPGIGIPIDNAWMKRQRPTASQMQLNLKARENNLRAAFTAITHRRYRHIAIFDDVMTTGATMRSLAKSIPEAGLCRIDFWSLARTPK